MEKIIIIGAGIAGMSAGIYAQINGFETEIYEMHSISGGECTGWDRGEYHFDGSIHYLTGSEPGNPLNRVWREVGALDDSVGIINNEYFYRFEENGQAVNIYRDIDRLEKHLLEISPEDSLLIREMCKTVRALKMEMPVEKPADMASKLEAFKMIVKMLPHFSVYKKYNAMTIRDFAEQFKHPLLRKAMQFEIPNQYSAITLLGTFSSLNSGGCGWPVGGSRKLAARMEQRYQSLGGKIYFQSKIKKIKIESGKAVGVILADGSERMGDYIISAADGYATLQNMLEGKYLDQKFEKLYSDRQTYPIYTTVQVSVGVAADLSNESHMLFFKPAHAINAGGVVHPYIGLKHFCYDETFAPKGKSVITVLLAADYDWWKDKYRDREAYKTEKKRITAEVCTAIEERFPEVKGKIEQTDVATPVTYERYCNAWRGSWMSWMTTPQCRIRGLTGKLNRLENFYMASQWTWTIPCGGLPVAVVTGKWAIQRICKELNYRFKTGNDDFR